MINWIYTKEMRAIKKWGIAHNELLHCVKFTFLSGSISEIMVPSSLKFTIVVVIRPKEYCKLKNKFWNASKNSPTSFLVDLRLKLEFHSL
ncbi:hypothetical protein Zmor_026473 [Zophobas morio]|uniref:Uncharacterized protein n=1 Tax=Zophobas morio TaxID=2755281 RepID=A0AA38HUD7_9CUCU|nr:hypothetical protein Zmor_026473 [Zophobas morio]